MTVSARPAAPVLAAEALSGVAGALADRSRAAICLALLDGRAWTAGELARHARIAPSTASEHLTLLVDAGLLAEERQGRHRYLRLAGQRVAELVEDLAALSPAPARPSSLRAVRAAGDLAQARTCYDHLAGTLGVAVYDGLVARGLLDTAAGLALTPDGRDWFGDALARVPTSGRPLLRTCLDWTERRHHLGGALAAAWCTQLLDRGWLVRGAHPRAVRLTVDGAAGLADLLEAAT